jgi:F-type H+-transporting ATPase subunit b
MSIIEDPNTWILVAFVTFIGIVVWKGGRKILTILDDRAAKIAGELDQARKFREEAQELLAGYQHQQREVANEAEAIAAQAREEAERKADQGKKDLDAYLERRTQLAEQNVAQAETQAINAVRNAAIDVALSAAGRALRDSISDTQRDALVDQTIADLAKKLN